MSEPVVTIASLIADGTIRETTLPRWVVVAAALVVVGSIVVIATQYRGARDAEQ